MPTNEINELVVCGQYVHFHSKMFLVYGIVQWASLKGPLNVSLTLPQSGTLVGSTLCWIASIFFVRWAKVTGQSKLSLHWSRRPVGPDVSWQQTVTSTYNGGFQLPI